MFVDDWRIDRILETDERVDTSKRCHVWLEPWLISDWTTAGGAGVDWTWHGTHRGCGVDARIVPYHGISFFWHQEEVSLWTGCSSLKWQVFCDCKSYQNRHSRTRVSCRLSSRRAITMGTLISIRNWREGNGAKNHSVFLPLLVDCPLSLSRIPLCSHVQKNAIKTSPIQNTDFCIRCKIMIFFIFSSRCLHTSSSTNWANSQNVFKHGWFFYCTQPRADIASFPCLGLVTGSCFSVAMISMWQGEDL